MKNTKEKGSWELKKKISMKWNEQKITKKQQQQQQYVQCAFAVSIRLKHFDAHLHTFASV